MAYTVDDAARKWESKTNVMPSNYNNAMSDFLGFDVSNSGAARKYQAKISAPGAADKYKTNLVAAFRS